jgi:hypothetical protein
MHFYLILTFVLIPNHTACTATAVKKPILAQLEPILELVDILEEIQCW